ncbi:hypothetical protein BH11BAC2_BH11BAC2_01050 [soil metagenome]
MKLLKRIFKWTGITILLLIVVLAITVTLLQNKKHEAPYPAIHASTDSLVIARGKALVYGPAHCADCHAPKEELDKYNQGEIVNLSGGHIFDIPPGLVRTRNITSDKETGIGNLPDSVIARSLRYSVGFDGRILPEFMPFHNLSNEDLTAVISYLRTLPPIHHEVERTQWNMLGKTLFALVIKPVGPDKEIVDHVDIDSTPAYGKYLVESVANCKGCHTNRDMATGAFVGPELGGGFHMVSEVDPTYTVVTPNITTYSECGKLAVMTENDFIARFRKGKVIVQSTMPWGAFSRMSDLELKAIYRYLQTVPPVKNNPGPTLIATK